MIHSSDGLSSYQRLRSKNYSNNLCSFGEIVLCKETPAPSKLQTSWTKGVWIGKCTETDESFILTQSGVQRSRIIKRLVPESQHESSFVASVRGLPWDLTQTGRYDPDFTLPPDFLPAMIGPSSSRGTDAVDPSAQAVPSNDPPDPAMRVPVASLPLTSLRLTRKMTDVQADAQRAQKQARIQGQKRSADDHLPDDLLSATQSHSCRYHYSKWYSSASSQRRAPRSKASTSR